MDRVAAAVAAGAGHAPEMMAILPAGWRLDVRGAVGSTNDEAKALAEAGAPHGTVVWAARQAAGRGRHTRGWESPEGNLYASTVLRPGGPAARAGQLAFVVALALAEGIAATAPALDIRVKWPNDLLIRRRKVSGILLESAVAADGSLAWVVAGTGVNLTSHPDGAGFMATSLAAEGASQVAPAALLSAYAAALDQWLGRWQTEGFGPVRSAWLKRAVGLGEDIVVRLDRETLAGRFADLDPRGALVLECPGLPPRLITAGDVFFGDPSAACD